MSKYFGKCCSPSTAAPESSFLLRCPSFLLSKFASQLKLIQSVVRVRILGICITSSILWVLLSEWQFPSPRNLFPGSHVPEPQFEHPGCQGPVSQGSRVPGSQLPESWVSGSWVPRSQVLILDYAVQDYAIIQFRTKKFLSAFFYNVTLNVNIEFLKIAMSEPIVSTKQA